MNCPVCGSVSTSTFLSRGGVPVHQHLILADRSAAASVRRGDLTMAACAGCGFVFNRTFDPSLLSYDESYDNSQDSSPAFKHHLESRVQHLVGNYKLGGRIAEIGCGKGTFLKQLVLAAGGESTGVGWDPSYEGSLTDLDGRLQFHRLFYGPECKDTQADVVICRHVIEHIPRPVEFLKAIRASLSESPQVRLFFETPCVNWILTHRVLWDFFYEHCSIYTAASLSSAFHRAGFQVDDVQHVFGGQYLWLEASIAPEPTLIADQPGEIPTLAERFGVEEQKSKERWLEQVDALSARGKVALWGAGAKGVTFANLIDPDRTLVDCLVDMNPQKQGHFLPGTGHPIVDYRTLGERGVGGVILMNRNYRAEIEGLLREARIDVTLVDESTLHG